jgi:hypothetical protein
MSLATIRTAVATIVAGVSGVVNVYEEQPVGTDEADALEKRTAGDRVHFWHVKVAPETGEEYAGGVEPRFHIHVTGHRGVARDAPTDGVTSDIEFADLAHLVLKTLQDPHNRNPANCVESTVPRATPIVRKHVLIGPKRVPCHVVEIDYVAQEEN